ncbi:MULTISPECIES: TetR/AcrR family transcriptional regulator [Bradyrhizobium]|uniref:TetR/AcrR family transcriptional regulator n=1 Tax=Bradyrhizobium brasilense TaxID=1419277 RepID=UPI000976ECDA|nr:TetR/AcrR family transcriptional regulator [Bradyrhizobium brasilense]OMI05832.1 hypothetical protein BSN85_23075 [Bradyrhizobium brasilense]
MRYPKDQKEKTRRHIIESVSIALRRDGIAASSIVPLMKEAGLTQGAFYKIFASRDELLAEAILFAMSQTRSLARQWIADARTAGENPIARLIDEYLHERRLTNWAKGCPIAALGAELWRQSDTVRRAVSEASAETLDVISLELPPTRKNNARALYMLMAGVLSSARLAVTREEQIAILADGRRSARFLAGCEPEPTSPEVAPTDRRAHSLYRQN